METTNDSQQKIPALIIDLQNDKDNIQLEAFSQNINRARQWVAEQQENLEVSDFTCFINILRILFDPLLTQAQLIIQCNTETPEELTKLYLWIVRRFYYLTDEYNIKINTLHWFQPQPDEIDAPIEVKFLEENEPKPLLNLSKYFDVQKVLNNEPEGLCPQQKQTSTTTRQIRLICQDKTLQKMTLP